MTNSNPGCLAPFLRLFQKAPRPSGQPEKLPYLVRNKFFSDAEASFFRVLKAAVAERLLIFSKVSLVEIFYISHPEVNQAYRNKIDRKHVDFLLCSADTLQPVLAIELDDSSHQRPDRVKRDEFVDAVFSTAGLPLLHISAQRAYNTQELSQKIKDALS